MSMISCCTDPPILTPAACEGTSTLFPVDYFDEQAYLTQSGQLYMEAAAMALGKVYSFGPTFRAEKSKTRRHLTEFWMVEPEVAYATLEDIMKLAEDFISFIVARVLETRRHELGVLGRDVAQLENIKAPFPRLSYDEAAAMLNEGFAKGELENAFEYGNDFGSPDETYISSKFDRPVMIHRYPAAVKAFYMEPDPDDLTKALCVDVLAPEGYGEVIGGSQRMGRTRGCWSAFISTSCRKRPSSGIWICASSAAYRTPALAWVWSAPWRGSASWTMCGRPFPSRACCTGCIRSFRAFGRSGCALLRPCGS